MEDDRIIFSDGTSLEYRRGRFDNWCVYLDDIAPTDEYCFQILNRISEQYGRDRVYNDFVCVYDMVNEEFREKEVDRICEMSKNYMDDSLEVQKLFSILYMTMIAEENRENTMLGKRIKRLGVYMLLVEEETEEYAATFMRGMSWEEIDNLCTDRGF